VLSLSPDGSRLAFSLGETPRACTVNSSQIRQGSGPTPQLADTGMGPGFEVAPDGRLLALMAPSGSRPPQSASNVTLVLNFFSEVNRRTSQ
jgi:hypothetical protein